MRLAVSLLLVVPAFAAPTAAEIMARVAANQDRAEQLRSRYVYRQNIDVRIRDTHNLLMRQEVTALTIAPTPSGSQRTESSFTGRYREGANMLPYTASGEPMAQGFRNEADAHIAHNMRDSLTGTKDSKDGLSPRLFPLTSEEQTHYLYSLKGEQTIAEIPVYRIAFQPKRGAEAPDTPWAGEALIGRADFEPVQISTKLAHGIPFVARAVFGTNFRGLGFTVSYRKLEDGVWFPASYGAEFDFRVLFIYSRKVSISLANTEFQRTSADTHVTFENDARPQLP